MKFVQFVILSIEILNFKDLVNNTENRVQESHVQYIQKRCNYTTDIEMEAENKV